MNLGLSGDGMKGRRVFMRQMVSIVLMITMSLSVANCSDDGGGGGGGTATVSNNDRDCKYNPRASGYRDRRGRSCDHHRNYEDDACYNFYFRPYKDSERPKYAHHRDRYNHWGQTRAGHRPRYRQQRHHRDEDFWHQYGGYYTDRHGKRVDCNLGYIDFRYTFPHSYYHPTNGYQTGCAFWGVGLVAVPMGFGATVCVYSPAYTNYQPYYNPYVGYSGWYGGHFGGGLGGSLGWDFYLTFNW